MDSPGGTEGGLRVGKTGFGVSKPGWRYQHQPGRARIKAGLTQAGRPSNAVEILPWNHRCLLTARAWLFHKLLAKCVLYIYEAYTICYVNINYYISPLSYYSTVPFSIHAFNQCAKYHYQLLANILQVSIDHAQLL